MALVGQWNYYLHDGLSTGGSSVAAIEGSNNRVAEAEAALAAFEVRTAEADATVTAAIAATSAGSPTGRSRLVTAQMEAARVANIERARLTAELREARDATVEVRSTSTDPRPVDGQVAAATGLDRGLVASLLDLLRSGVVEALLVMGAGLGLSGSLSRVGVPKDEASFAPADPPEVVAETAPAPEAPPEPAPRRRFVLPEATAEDLALALAIGPLAASPAAASEPPATDAPETPEAPPAASNDDEYSEPATEVDPLMAAALQDEAA